MPQIRDVQIADNTITSENIKDSTITSTDILDATVASADIEDGTITDGKIGGLTWAKMAAYTYNKMSYNAYTFSTNGSVGRYLDFANVSAQHTHVFKMSMNCKGVAKYYVITPNSNYERPLYDWCKAMPLVTTGSNSGFDFEILCRWAGTYGPLYLRFVITSGSILSTDLIVFNFDDSPFVVNFSSSWGESQTVPTTVLKSWSGSFYVYENSETVVDILSRDLYDYNWGTIQPVITKRNFYAIKSGRAPGGTAASATFVKTTAAGGGDATLNFTDNTNTNDMHGLLPGGFYNFKMYCEIGSGAAASGGPTPSNYVIKLYEYYNAQWNSTTLYTMTSINKWELVNYNFTITTNTTGAYIQVEIKSAEATSSHLGFDEAFLFCYKRNYFLFNDCENTSSPSFDGTSNLTNATWARSNVQVKTGSYSWCLTKSSAGGGGEAYVALTNDMSINSLHSIVPGNVVNLKFDGWTDCASATSAKIKVWERPYWGSQLINSQTISLSTTNSWESIDISFPTNVWDNGFSITVSIDSSEAANKTFYIDNISWVSELGSGPSMYADTLFIAYDYRPYLDGSWITTNGTYYYGGFLGWRDWVGVINKVKVWNKYGIDTNWHGVGDSNEPGFINGSNYGSGKPPLRFRRNAYGVVELQGWISISASYRSIFNLPYGYRPGYTSEFPILSNLGVLVLRISPWGVVLLDDDPVGISWLCFDGIKFLGEL